MTVIRCAALAAVLSALQVAPAATAAPLPASPANATPEVRAMLQQEWRKLEPPTARGAGTARVAGDEGLDVTAPVLTAIDMPTRLDAAVSGAQIKISYKVQDDLSGFSYACFFATNALGQTKDVCGYSTYPTLAGTESMALDFGKFDAPVVWTISRVVLLDYAGNQAAFEGDALAALGNNSFQVNNRLWTTTADTVKPVLNAGKIGTPVLSLTQTLPGMTTPEPILLVGVDVTESGSPNPSGLRVIVESFCLADSSYCLGAYWSTFLSGGKGSGRYQTFGGGFAAAAPPGEYILQYVVLIDFGGNSNFLMSTDFGGSTDFRPIFRSGRTVTLVP